MRFAVYKMHNASKKAQAMYKYMQFTVAVPQHMSQQQAEELFNELAAAMNPVLDAHDLDEDSSAYIYNDANEAVF